MRVDCDTCGTALPVGDTTRFVTCTRCNARLAIEREGAALYTRVFAGDSEAGLDETPIPNVAPDAPRVGRSKFRRESLLRLGVGGVLIASDLYWSLTEPALHTFYVRAALLGAGAWLIVTGGWRGLANVWSRLHASDDRQS